ncbi:MAG: prepilin peptidase [Actinomycetota bacterium]
MPAYVLLDTALCLFASVHIISYDLRHHRITNLSLGRFILAIAALKFVESIAGAESVDFLGSIADAVVALALFTCIYYISGSSMGLGDVKLATVLAALAGLGSIRNFIFWICAIWIWGGVHASVIALRYRTFHRRIAFAPALFGGTLTYLAMRIWSSLPQ